VINKLSLLKRERLIIFFILVVLALLFVVAFSQTTSPVYMTLGGDSSIFRFIGYTMTKGYRLYVDIFDHKGPVLFFIQYLGQLVHPGRSGALLMQMIFLSTSLIILYKIGRLFVGKKVSLSLSFIYLLLLSYFYDFGNLSEEFSQVFLLGTAYIFLYFVLEKIISKRKKNVLLFIAGACLSALIFIRLNNAFPALAAAGAYFIYLLTLRPGIKSYINELVYYLLGIFLLSAIVFEYFILTNSLYDMVYATFIFNFLYSEFNMTSLIALMKTSYFLWAMFGLAVSFVGGVMYYIKSKNLGVLLIVLFSSLGAFFAVMMAANGYPHYLQLIVPSTTLGALLIIITLRNIKIYKFNFRFVIILSFIVFFSLLSIRAVDTISKRNNFSESAYIANTVSLVSVIPDSEKNNVFGCNAPASFYIAGKILPSNRFFTLQDWWSRSDAKIYNEINYMFSNSPPRWVVVYGSCSRLTTVLGQKYKSVKASGDINILRLVE